MGFGKIALIFFVVSMGMFVQFSDTSFTENLSNIACRANFYDNYTAALASYGSKAKVVTNPFYQGNSTCFAECVIKVMKIQVSTLGEIMVPDFTPCSNGVGSKLQKRNSMYCYMGVCDTIQNIAAIISAPPPEEDDDGTG